MYKIKADTKETFDKIKHIKEVFTPASNGPLNKYMHQINDENSFVKKAYIGYQKDKNYTRVIDIFMGEENHGGDKNNNYSIEKDKIITDEQYLSLIRDEPIFLEFETDKISFNFFGCWNSGNYSGYKMVDIKLGTNTDNVDACSWKSMSALPIIADMMDVMKYKTDPKFAIIAGDNYYEYIDIYPNSNIDNGFAQLSKLYIPHFIALGNHDITPPEFFWEFYKSYNDLKFPAYGKSLEMVWSSWIFPSTNYVLHVKSNDNVHAYFIIFDSNVLAAASKDKPVSKYMMFKQEFIKNIPALINAFVENSIKKIKKLHESRNDIYHILLVAHHPILAISHDEMNKYKKDKCKNEKHCVETNISQKKVSATVDNRAFLNDIHEIMKREKIKFYLCADEHNFQHIVDVKSGIHQIVSGGASAGVEIPSFDKTLTFSHMYDTEGYQIEGTSNEHFRAKMLLSAPHYVKFDIDKNGIKFDVISLGTLITPLTDHKGQCSKDADNCVFSSKNYATVYSSFIPTYNNYFYQVPCAKLEPDDQLQRTFYTGSLKGGKYYEMYKECKNAYTKLS